MKHAAGFLILLALSLSVHGCDTDSQVERTVNSSHVRTTEASISATESLLYEDRFGILERWTTIKRIPKNIPANLSNLTPTEVRCFDAEIVRCTQADWARHKR